MQSSKNISFDNIAEDIIKTEKFNQLKKESHHGLTRYIHVMRVSKATYKISKKLHMDYVSATRAALLHDYFTSNDFDETTELKKLELHPSIACKNASIEFELNNIEKNAIEAHMFPMGKTIPKYKESWLLTLVDKGVATYEQLNFKCRNAVALYMLFIINMILFGQK